MGRGRTVVIKVEQNRKQNREWESNKHITHTDIPEMHKPPSINRRKECLTRRQRRQIHTPHLTYMHKARKKYNRQRRAIIGDEYANVVLE